MSSLFAFPGQGAQRPDMLDELPESAAPLLAEAGEVLGEDVRALDSAEALQDTRAVQLCLLIAGVAAARTLIDRGARPDYVAGLSIGAYGAAVVAGALAFADALRLVSLRGELMQQAWPQGYGMTALIGLDIGQVEALLAETEGPVHLANINAPNQLVIAGSEAAMAEVGRRARMAGAGGVKRLAVSVPSHCELLAKPAAELAEAFAGVEIKRPQVRYLSSSSARPVVAPQELRDDLAFNMCRVVDWQGTLQNAYERGVRLHVEMPPGAVLSGLARRVMEQGTVVAWQGARLDTLDALLQEEGSADQ